MSILSSNPLRKTSADSHRTEKQPVCEDAPEGNFRELLQVERASEELREKNFFAMVAQDEEEESEKADEQTANAIACAMPCPGLISSLEAASAHSIAASKITELSAEMEAMFEKMVACMMVMDASNDVETTLFLDSANFASSSFYGTQITIKEFNTAPRAFNVEIISNPSAVAVIDASKNNLLSHLQKGNFNFSIHRLDTHIEQHNAERPAFHRKESTDQEHNDREGDSGK